MIHALSLLATLSIVPLFGQDDAAAGMIGICCTCIPLLLGGLLGAFNIWMLVDCIMNEQKMPPDDNQFVLWLLLILFTSGIGAIAYYFIRRPKNRAA